MKESREINKYTSLIIVLSVLLAISLVAGATFAWFASSQTKNTTINLGDPVVVNIVENADGKILPDGAELPFVISSGHLLPGMKINTYASVKFQESKTPAILRVKLYATVEGGTASTAEIVDLADNLNQQIYNKAYTYNPEGSNWMYDDETSWWYYTAGEENNFIDVKNSVLKSIDCELGPIIDFLNPYTNDQFLIMPTTVDNKFATSKVTFWFTVQAVQAFIPVPDDDPNGGFLVNTISNVEKVFNEAFPGSGGAI